MPFLNLPSELVSERVLPFLPPKWIVRLDSAVAVKAKRVEWLLTVSRIHHFERFCYEITKYKLHEIHWLCSRNIVFHRLDMNIRTDTLVVQKLLGSPTFSASRVTRLEMLPITKLDAHTRRILCNFVSQFTGLHELYTCTQDRELDFAILSAATSLRKLRISLGGPVSPLLDQHHPHLEELLIYNDLNMHADSVTEYLRHCPNLRSLTTRGQGSDALLQALAIHCKNLHTLKLELSNHTSRAVTDAGIIALAAGCPLLQSLEFSSMGLLTEVAFIALAEGCTTITKLSVYMCNGITDRSLCAIGQHWPQLLELNVVNNLLITDAGVEAIAQGCPLLTVCHLGACRLLTDTAVIAVARYCSHITTLSVSYCPLITDAAVICVLQNCACITVLSAAQCRLLTVACLAPLAKQPALARRLKLLLLPWSESFAGEGLAKIQARHRFVRFE